MNYPRTYKVGTIIVSVALAWNACVLLVNATADEPRPFSVVVGMASFIYGLYVLFDMHRDWVSYKAELAALEDAQQKFDVLREELRQRKESYRQQRRDGHE